MRTIETRACPETLRPGSRDFAGPDERSAPCGKHSPGDRYIWVKGFMFFYEPKGTVGPGGVESLPQAG